MGLIEFHEQGKNEIKCNRTHAGQHIAFRTTGLIWGQAHMENLQMRWHWWNLDTITLWLVSTAGRHPESFCVNLHFKHIVAFLKFGVSSLSSSVLFKSSKGAKLTCLCSQVISSYLRFFFERLKQHFNSFLIMLISLRPFASAAFSMILWILKWVPNKSSCIHVYLSEAERKQDYQRVHWA